jgi:hypothetical protein
MIFMSLQARHHTRPFRSSPNPGKIFYRNGPVVAADFVDRREIQQASITIDRELETTFPDYASL